MSRSERSGTGGDARSDECAGERQELYNKLLAEWDAIRSKRDEEQGRHNVSLARRYGGLLQARWAGEAAFDSGAYDERMRELNRQMQQVRGMDCRDVRRWSARLDASKAHDDARVRRGLAGDLRNYSQLFRQYLNARFPSAEEYHAAGDRLAQSHERLKKKLEEHYAATGDVGLLWQVLEERRQALRELEGREEQIGQAMSRARTEAERVAILDSSANLTLPMGLVSHDIFDLEFLIDHPPTPIELPPGFLPDLSAFDAGGFEALGRVSADLAAGIGGIESALIPGPPSMPLDEGGMSEEELLAARNVIDNAGFVYTPDSPDDSLPPAMPLHGFESMAAAATAPPSSRSPVGESAASLPTTPPDMPLDDPDVPPAPEGPALSQASGPPAMPTDAFGAGPGSGAAKPATEPAGEPEPQPRPPTRPVIDGGKVYELTAEALVQRSQEDRADIDAVLRVVRAGEESQQIFMHDTRGGLGDRGVAAISDLFGGAAPPNVRDWDRPKLLLGAAQTELDRGNVDQARRFIALARAESRLVEDEWNRYLGATESGAGRAVAILARVVDWSEGLTGKGIPGGAPVARAVFGTVEQTSEMAHGLRPSFGVEEMAWDVSMVAVTGAVGDVAKGMVRNGLTRVAGGLSRALGSEVSYEVFREFLASGGSKFVTEAYRTAAEGVRSGHLRPEDYAETVGARMLESGMRDALWRWLQRRAAR